MSDDVIRMQQEAANRVARMQEQSRRLVADHPPPLYGGRRESAPQAAAPSQEERRTAASLEQRRRETEQAKVSPSPAKSRKEDKGLAGLFGGDQEQLLLLMLAVLLVKTPVGHTPYGPQGFSSTEGEEDQQGMENRREKSCAVRRRPSSSSGMALATRAGGRAP